MENRQEQPAADRDAEAARLPPPELVGLRVLAADADPWMRLFYKELLLSLGHQIIVTSNGRHLVTLSSVVQPDLILTDVQLPEVNGLEAADQLSQSWCAPILFVTADRSPLSLPIPSDRFLFRASSFLIAAAFALLFRAARLPLGGTRFVATYPLLLLRIWLRPRALFFSAPASLVCHEFASS